MTIYLLTCLQAHSLRHQEMEAGCDAGAEKRGCTAAKKHVDNRQSTARFKRSSKMDADRLCVLHAQLQLQQKLQQQQ